MLSVKFAQNMHLSHAIHILYIYQILQNHIHYLKRLHRKLRSKPESRTVDQLRVEFHIRSTTPNPLECLYHTSSVIHGHIRRSFFIVRIVMFSAFLMVPTRQQIRQNMAGKWTMTPSCLLNVSNHYLHGNLLSVNVWGNVIQGDVYVKRQDSTA